MDYEKPEKMMVTVDIVVFTIQKDDLKVLLVKRKYDPYKGMWAIPGGFTGKDETLEKAARRELLEETGVKDIYIEQLFSFGDPGRDPRGRVVTVTYYALINSEQLDVKGATDVEAAEWFSVYKLPKLAFDHKRIFDYALRRLRFKLEYSTVCFQLLAKKFTLTELQNAYEIIFDRGLDKRNFRKKILSLGLIEPTNETKMEGAHRPAKLYSFNQEHMVMENFIRRA